MISQPISPTLDNTNLVIQTFYKPEGDFLFGIDVCADPLPVAFSHLGELFVGFEPLPLQGGSPVIEKSLGPAFFFVVPELAEGFLEQVAVFNRLFALNNVLKATRPPTERFFQ